MLSKTENKDLSVEAIIETVLQSRVVGFLHSYVYPLMCKDMQANIALLRSNMIVMLRDTEQTLNLSPKVGGWVHFILFSLFLPFHHPFFLSTILSSFPPSFLPSFSQVYIVMF